MADNNTLFPKLKPCPFCGGEAHIFVSEYEGVYVICSNCHARTETLTDRPYFTAYVPAVERVVDRWNRRADNETYL